MQCQVSKVATDSMNNPKGQHMAWLNIPIVLLCVGLVMVAWILSNSTKGYLQNVFVHHDFPKCGDFATFNTNDPQGSAAFQQPKLPISNVNIERVTVILVPIQKVKANFDKRPQITGYMGYPVGEETLYFSDGATEHGYLLKNHGSKWDVLIPPDTNAQSFDVVQSTR